jgi:hypothetical protein
VLITALLSAILCGLHELRLILQESRPFRFRRTNRRLIALRIQHDKQGAGRDCEIEGVLKKLGLGASQMYEIVGGVSSCDSTVL